MSKQVEDYWAAQEEKKKNRAVRLKEICQGLVILGAEKIEVEYDGYGDSGQIEHLVVVGKDGKDVDMEAMGAKGAKQDSDGAFSETLGDELRELMYDHLPDGWEINEGSFGTMELDLTNPKLNLQINHSERVQETVDSTIDVEL